MSWTSKTRAWGRFDAEQRDGRRRAASRILVQPRTKAANDAAGAAPSDASRRLDEHTRIEHVVTLSRGTNERGVNAVKFSPSGLHLVAAGDGGTVVVWSVPPAGAGSGAGNSSSFWSSIDKETDAPMKILFNQSDDVMDVTWSADSRRFAACSLDHTLTVWERAAGGNPAGIGQGEWRNVHRSAKDHTHYIQGVAYDPKGVYLASMGSDRMVKVYSRKHVKDSAVKAELAKYAVDDSAADSGGTRDGRRGKEREENDKKAILQSKVLPQLLTDSTFALQNKVKTMKWIAARPAAAGASSGEDAPDKDPPKRHHMFADELTLGSFFRRLAFTAEGAFLVVPAALWHGRGERSAASGAGEAPTSPTSVASGEGRLAESSFATYLFARHHFDQPYKVLTGLEKPSVVVRPNPLLFQLPPNAKRNTNPASLPYRSVFAVLTADTVLLYDTHHDRPLAMARGLHYAGLTDAAWSRDGRTLFVTSSDGYVSILNFGNGELGEVYDAPKVRVVNKVDETVGYASTVAESKVASAAPSVGSKQPEPNAVTVNTLVPKKNKIAPTPVNAAADSEGGSEKKKVTFATPAADGSDQPEPSQPAINTLVPKKKKKKIAPTIVTPVVQQKQSVEESGETPTVENKRPAEEEAAPSTVETTVHILIPKKKKKVASSSTPVAIM